MAVGGLQDEDVVQRVVCTDVLYTWKYWFRETGRARGGGAPCPRPHAVTGEPHRLL